MSYTEYTEAKFVHPARLWLPLEDIEHGALDQIRNVSRHPELGDSIAVMPDCHQGYGVTIGSVVLTDNSIIPNAVGVDIGCGMTAYETNVKLDREVHNEEFWREWARKVAKRVPHGFGSFETDQRWRSFFDTSLSADELNKVMQVRAPRQLGTLGGGNHFLEAQVDENDNIWFMVHSGSRYIGKTIADYYHKLAIEESKKRGLDVGEDLSSLTLEHQTAHDYIHDMTWAMNYAYESRTRMCNAMFFELGSDGAQFTPIDCMHNYAVFDRNSMQTLHRKGATNAEEGELGIIPGSMGSSSYIVRGKGNIASHNSCSHGAGRTMSRGAAKRAITDLAQLETALSGTHTRADFRQADEAPHAYKDINTVINRQLDLIDLVHILQPLITVKGGGRDEG